MYDPIVGRFTTVGPAGQFHSPYVGMGNDSVIGIDPTGGTCPTCPEGSQYDAYRNAGQSFGYEAGVGVFNNDFNIVVLGSRHFDVQKVGVFDGPLTVGNMLDMQSQLADVEAMMSTFNKDNVGTILFLAEAGGIGSGKGPNQFSVTPRGVNSVGTGFRSFSALKRSLGPAGSGRAWHHIVEQTPGNVQRFGAQTIHNTNNVVNVAHGAGTVHARISGYYSSIRRFTNGKTVRQWLSNQSFDDQYKFGVDVMNRVNNGLPLR